MKPCPYCANEIQDAAIKCQHCGEFLEAHSRTPFEQPSEKSANIEPVRQRRFLLSFGHVLVVLAVTGVAVGVAKLVPPPSGGGVALLLMCAAFFSVLCPVFLQAAGWFRRITQPDWIAGSMEQRFFTQIFWKVGPPLTALLAAPVASLALAYFVLTEVAPGAVSPSPSVSRPPEVAQVLAPVEEAPSEPTPVEEALTTLVLGVVKDDVFDAGAGCIATNVAGERVFVTDFESGAVAFNGSTTMLAATGEQQGVETYADAANEVRVSLTRTGEPVEAGVESSAWPAILTLSALGRETTLAVTLTCGS